MKHDIARQIKWDIVDHLLTNFTDTTNFTYGDYSDEQREYAKEVIQRIAASLNVKNHMDL